MTNRPNRPINSDGAIMLRPNVGFLFPNIKLWSSKGPTCNISKRVAFQVAPQDITTLSDSKYWSFADAQEISAIMSEYGWRLPSPVEIQLITTHMAYKGNQSIITGDFVRKQLGFELLGYGVRGMGDGDFFEQYVGEQGSYWTNAVRKHPNATIGDTGIVYNVSKEFGTLYTRDLDENGAAVRLIRDIG